MLLIFLTIPRPPLSTLFPYTTLFRSRGLPQPLVVSVHRSGPGEVEHGPEQHRGVTIRENEAIAVGPDRILGVEAHHAVPEGIDQRRERHRRAGVSGPGLLDRAAREGT